MSYRGNHLFDKRGVLLALLLGGLFLTGCEGDKGSTSTATTQGPQDYPPVQPDINLPDTKIEALKIRLFDDPNNDVLLSALGDAYFESRRFQDAIPIYEKAVSINPNNYDSYNDLGLAYFYTRNEIAALDAIDKSIAAKPDYKYAWLSKGFILVSIGRYEEAKEPLLKAKELDPGGNIGIEAENFLQKIEELKAKLPNRG